MNSIKPIRSEADHRAALAEIDRLMDAAPGSAEEDRLDVLSTLVSAWEDEHVALAAADPVEAIRFHMEQHNRSQADLAALLGSRSRASEIMSRTRRLTIEMVWKLHVEWDIPLESLAAPYPTVGRVA
jgi:antitoxin component HigA of HigAB toxin-antitoxin module